MNSYTLQFEKKSLPGLPFDILNNVYYRPQDAILSGSHKIVKKAGEMMGEVLTIERFNREIWVNFSFLNLLHGTSYEIRSKLFSRLTKQIMITPNFCSVFRNSPPLRKYIGMPDFIVNDESGHAIIGEIKIGARKSNHKYSFQQYTKYMHLAALCKCSSKTVLPKKITHLLILPSENLSENILDKKLWLPTVDNQLLTPNINSENIDMTIWKTELRNFLYKKEVTIQNELEKEKIELLMSQQTPDIVPTYVYSWIKLLEIIQESFGNDANYLQEGFGVFSKMVLK